eukprot:653816-Hanusia_phi.AAC.1
MSMSPSENRALRCSGICSTCSMRAGDRKERRGDQQEEETIGTKKKKHRALEGRRGEEAHKERDAGRLGRNGRGKGGGEASGTSP